MIVRFKLDHLGIKISLKQWSHFQLEERHKLVELPCTTIDQANFYSGFLTQLIAERTLIAEKTKEVAVTIKPEIDAEWFSTDAVPERVIKQAITMGVAPPHLNTWAALSHLQRFTLCKLSRAGHDNDNFIPAMREFGLLLIRR